MIYGSLDNLEHNEIYIDIRIRRCIFSEGIIKTMAVILSLTSDVLLSLCKTPIPLDGDSATIQILVKMTRILAETARAQ